MATPEGDPDLTRAGAEHLFDVLADLEARAGALHHRERSEEVDDRSRAAYGEVSLESRLMASVRRAVACDVRGVGTLSGQLERVGDGWFLLVAGRQEWSIRTAAVLTVRGVSERSVPREAWAAADRLGITARLRRLGEEGRLASLHLEDGSRREGRILRVGADFVELEISHDRAPGERRRRDLDLVALVSLSGVRVEA